MLRTKLKLDNVEYAQQHELQAHQSNGITNESQISQYFFTHAINSKKPISETFLEYEESLNDQLSELVFDAPVSYVYNPLKYASEPHENFVRKFCTGEKKILFVGMNPGPWGMCQTGVPFGEVKITSEWLQITGNVLKPSVECPKKEITGFNCHRSEPSGKKFFGLFKEICGTPENFFRYAFVHNLCPLAMMAQGSANITPQDIKGDTKQQLECYCREKLFEILQLLNTEIVIAIGHYTKTQVMKTLKKHGIINIRVVYMPHPSPRVVGNENWPEKALKVLNDNDLMKYFKQL